MGNYKNLFVTSPSEGDMIFLSAEKKIIFIAFGTYDVESIPAGMIPVGVVADRQGNQVMIVNKDNSLQKFADIYQWRLTGWALDGAPHEVSVGFYSSMPMPSNPIFTYQATTLEEASVQLQAWLDVYNAEISPKIPAAYKCYVDGDCIKMFMDPHARWYDYDLSMKGLTVTRDTAAVLPYSTNVYAKSGAGGYYKGIHFEKFYHYMRYEAGKDWWPSKPLTDIPNTPVPYDCYISDYATYLRGIYGEGEEGFKKYIADSMADFPSQRGALGLEFRDGKYNTYALADEMVHGTDRPMYPAANYCANVSYDHELLCRGNWILPSVYQMFKIAPKLKDDGTDKINLSLTAIGGKRLYLADTWSSSRYLSNNSWYLNGSRGYVIVSDFYTRLFCWPCLLLDMNEVNRINNL